MQITVSRAPANRQGPDVVEGLLTDDRVAVARGRREVDYNCSGRTDEACQCPKHDYISTGSLAVITEAGDRWPGLVRYWSLTLTIDESGERFTADTRLSIEREAGS